MPASISLNPSDLQVHRKWRDDPDLFARVRAAFSYGPGDDRATGCLYAHADGQHWPAEFATAGPALIDDLDELLGIRFPIVAFQAYLNGSGCDWHQDGPFDSQAILSLGATRTFGVRPIGGDPHWIQVEHGDLVVMPSGFQSRHQHCVPVEDVAGERCSLVFRTVARS
jgi:hypothetical protein